jgi:hypothetical protein
VSESYVKAQKHKVGYYTPILTITEWIDRDMVGLAKAALKNVLDFLNKRITDKTLQTCFKKVQGLLNDWPLAYSPKDCNDLEFFTPNHFLLSEKIGKDLSPIINYEKKGLEMQYKIEIL